MAKELTRPEAAAVALSDQVDPVLQPIVPGYLNNRRADADRMLAAIGRADFAEISVIGHSMRGSGGSYGFAELSALGARIEEAAQRRNGQECLKLVQQLTLFLANTQLSTPG